MNPEERAKLIREHAAGGSRAGGLICARCGWNRFWVIWTRHQAGQIVRRRHCRRCGEPVITREKVDDDEPGEPQTGRSNGSTSIEIGR